MSSKKIGGLFLMVLGIASLMYAGVAYLNEWTEPRKIFLSLASGLLFIVVGVNFWKKPDLHE